MPHQGARNGMVTQGGSDPAHTDWDFRSDRFRDQALALARMTGCPLVECRQELFIAEGDAVEAFMVLEERRGALAPAAWR